MGYFIHNKYDLNSINALAALDTVNNTVIDYYTNYDTYKYLDVSAGFGIVYDTLSYITPNTLIHSSQASNDNSHFNFSSSLIIKSIQRGVASLNIDGTAVTIALAKIKPEKAIVLLDGGGWYYASSSDSRAVSIVSAYIVSLAETSLTIKNPVTITSPGNVSYQVIEFR